MTMVLVSILAAAVAIAYLVGFSFVAVSASPPRSNDDKSSSQRTEDLRQSGEVFSEIGKILKRHHRAIREFLAGKSILEPGSRQAATDRFRTEHLHAAKSLHGQFDELERLLGTGVDLFAKERRGVRRYQSLNQQLESSLAELTPESPDAPEGVIGLVEKLLRENDALRHQVAKCERRVTELVSDVSRLQIETRTDALTMLPNRRAWEERLAEAEPEQSLVLVMADIDEFKSINDSHGHQAGDGVLGIVGTIFREARDVQAFRLAGDEFGLILEANFWERTGYLLDELRRRVDRAALNQNGRRVAVTVSVGAALKPAHQPNSDALQNADRALYAAKSAGGNCVAIDVGQEVVIYGAESNSVK